MLFDLLTFPKSFSKSYCQKFNLCVHLLMLAINKAWLFCGFGFDQFLFFLVKYKIANLLNCVRVSFKTIAIILVNHYSKLKNLFSKNTCLDFSKPIANKWDENEFQANALHNRLCLGVNSDTLLR